jgi:signal transduction histidine kinase/ActR/RegA family two-component response regulator
MKGTIPGISLGAAGLFLGLTWLLLRAGTPDMALHQRVLDAAQKVLLADASLQRDVLRARAGLLGSYDPLVAAMRNLRDATAVLRTAVDAADGAAAAAIAERHARLAAAVDNREALVEAFKSDVALLQNSLRYFAYASDRLTASLPGAPAPVLVEVAAFGNGMHRFVANPTAETASRLHAAIDRAMALPAPPPLRTELEALAPHARLIATVLPGVDERLAALLATPLTAQVGALRDAYLEQHGRAAARADLSRILLYLASILLLAWLARIFLRLRARLRFERLIAAIASALVGLRGGDVTEGIRGGLAYLARHLGADRAYLFLPAPQGNGGHTVLWRREGEAAAPSGWPETALAIHQRCGAVGNAGGIRHSRSTPLPPGPDRAALRRLGIRDWLCLPMHRPAGAQVGILGFETVRSARRWRADDFALLRTAGEIFGNVLERERAAEARAALESELRRAQRMEAIGTLAGGIAHDFNNILGAIAGYAEMAQETLDPDSRPWAHLRQVRQASARARGVIDQILAFSRQGETERRPVRLRQVVEEAVALLAASLPATISIELHAPDTASDAVVLGDAGRLQLVVINLCTNGAQAMAARGTLSLRLDRVEAAQPRALSHGTLAPGRHVRLAVTDTGHGIDAATARRIFEPFFTTKAPGRGTGLGLATTHAVVAEHDGALNLCSDPGRGSTFEVYLPEAGVPVPPEDAAAADAPHGSGEAVLLVDDESTLVVLGEEMLAARGYEPVGFDSPVRALAAFRADPARFDAVLTDEVMPAMTGTQLAAEIGRLRPGLPVLLMTGYSGPVRSDRLHDAGVREVLRKPLASRAIAEALARHLHSKGPARPGPL